MKEEVKIGLYNQQKLFFLFSLCCFYITITRRTIRFDLLDFKTQMHQCDQIALFFVQYWPFWP